MAHDRLGTAKLAKLRKQVMQPRLDFFTGIEGDPAIPAVRQARRQRQPQLASRRLLSLALVQPQLDLMQLGFAHDPGQAEQQAIMVGARVVEALAIGDQPPEKRAQSQELMPIPVVAGQPRGIEAYHQTRLAEADLGDQPLEAAAALAWPAASAGLMVAAPAEAAHTLNAATRAICLVIFAPLWHSLADRPVSPGSVRLGLEQLGGNRWVAVE